MENQTLETSVPTQEAEAAIVPSQPQMPVLPTPIFLGCREKSVIDKVKTMFGDEYELAVMNNDVLQKSTQVWFMGKLSEAEQQRASAMQQSTENYNTYLDFAKEFEENLVGEFKHYELKNYLRDHRKLLSDGKRPNVNVSNRDVRNIIDALGIHGLIMPMDPTVNYEKRAFRITIDDAARLAIINRTLSDLEMQKAGLEVFIADQQEQAANISKKFEAEVANIDNTLPATDEKPKRKAGRPKKAVTEEGALNQATDHLNDKGNVDTTTTKRKPTKQRIGRSGVSEQV